MRPVRLVPILACALLLAGCVGRTTPAPQPPLSVTAGPIDQKQALVLLPFENRLVVVDPEARQVIGRIELGQTAMDYAFGPEGKVYIPLHDTRDKPSAVAILDRATGQVSNVKVPNPGLDLIAITPDGTAFIRTSQADGDSDFLMAFDTQQQKPLGTIKMPGSIARMIPFSDTQVLVPVTNFSDYTGNLYLLDKSLSKASPLLPRNLELFAPFQVLISSDHKHAYLGYGGFVKDDQESREKFGKSASDPVLLEPRVEVLNLLTFEIERRIPLNVPFPQNLALLPDGRIVVGHVDMTVSQPITKLSVIDPDNGTVQEIASLNDPLSVQVHGQHLLVGAYKASEMDILRLPDFRSTGRVDLGSAPDFPPLTIP